MKKIKNIALLATLMSLIAGCNTVGTSTKSTNSTPSNISGSSSNSVNTISSSTNSSAKLPLDYKVSSYYEAMEILSKLKNYTIEVTYMEGSYKMVNNVFFTENAIFDDYVGDEYGYVLTNDGVVRVDYYENKLVSSEVYTKEDGTLYDTVWDKTFFTSFADINLKEFESAGNSDYFDITGKVNKIQFMNLVHAEQTDYDKLIALTAYFDENISNLMFSLEFSDGFGYSIEIKDINNTKIKVIDDFINAGNGAAQISSDLLRVRELFSGFNYKRVMYYEDENSEIKVSGYEYFNPDYFFVKFTNEYKMFDPASSFDSGYIGFNHKIIEGSERHGTYLTYFYDGQVIIFPQVAYYNPDITKFYNYPTYMTLFNGLQYFDLVNGTEHSYRTTNFELTLDFVENMQITESLAGYYIDGLTITLEDNIETENAKVTFVLEYSTDGVAGGENSAIAEFEFIEFGLANILEFDKILENAIDA